MKAFHKSITSRITRSLRDPLKTTAVIGLIILILLVIGSWDLYFNTAENFLIQVLVEFHGMVAEIAILGVLLAWITRYSEKWKNIEQAREQINDFKTLSNSYAKLMVLSSIKILNRHGIGEINLSNTSLPKASLDNVVLMKSNLNGVKLVGASLIQADLHGSALTGASFNKANLFHSNLSNVSGNAASFQSTNLIRADLSNGKFIMASFKNAYLNEANLQGANVLHADFTGAHLIKADFRNCKELTAEQLNPAIVRDCMFDPKIENDLRALRQSKA